MFLAVKANISGYISASFDPNTANKYVVVLIGFPSLTLIISILFSKAIDAIHILARSSTCIIFVILLSLYLLMALLI